MNLIILGPQGSGKGTQAEMLAEEYGFHYVEMGKILRSIAETKNDHAKTVKGEMQKGNLVPDEFVRLIVWDYISKHEKEQGFLFDGYPRSVPQYEHLNDMLRKFGKKLDWVVDIKISESESIKRLSARLTCPKCGRIYNTLTNPSPKGTLCECGGSLTQRDDDKPEAIKMRLSKYHEYTIPVLERAKTEGILVVVNGEESIEKVHSEIVTKIGL